LKFLARILVIVGVLGVSLAGLLWVASSLDAPAVHAASFQLVPPNNPSFQTQPPPEPGISNDYCLSCHAQSDQYLTMPSGEKVYITVDGDQFAHSIHGEYACVQCHTDIRTYPHPELGVETARDLTLSLNRGCERCHSDQAQKTKNSTHQVALDQGNKEAAVCSDCHSAHNVQELPANPVNLKQHNADTCERCHSAIHAEYKDSVHGNALFNDYNPDVPTCTDCHGTHNIAGPNTEEYFAMYSPQLCQKCHEDAELMGKYGLTADVFDTYISDFHGTSVMMFEPRYEGQQSNKPVCIDCHGVHTMKSASDPNSTVSPENLLVTCQKCHPDASSQFPSAWLGHYRPDVNRYPVVYYVNLFYKLFIPAVLGMLIFFVLIDVYRRFIRRPKERKHV
jgi:predicted CXXCH cytochrome family protein